MHKNKSFIELVEKHSICIPEIQRDYAQGRTDEKTIEIRNRFLDDISDTLNAEDKTLVLDFVYGSIEESPNVFTPLDGQQRLTTLFLLHWYLAPDEKKGVLQNAESSLFTYATRISSKDFCNELIKHSLNEIKRNIEEAKKNDENQEKSWNLSDGLMNEPWFLWSWRKDPTIQGMLVMLDAIDDRLKTETNHTHLWEKLVDKKRIVFHLLPLEEFKLTDELYVKMNARGKELSTFDILKSTLEEQMKKNNVSKEIQEEWQKQVDSKWMDLFWNKKAIPYLTNTEIDDSKKEKIVEEVETYYLRFLTRLMYFHLFLINDFEKPKKLNPKQFKEGIKSVREYAQNKDIIDLIFPLSKCGFFNESFFSFVITTMDSILYMEGSKVKDISELASVSMWEIEKHPVNNILNLFVREKITYLGRLLFFAQIQFAKYYNAEEIVQDEKIKVELNNWMRVIRNLVYNTTYSNINEFKDTLEALENLSQAVYVESDSKNILDYLANDGKITRFYGDQISEEQEKARQIINDTDKIRSGKIIEVENYAFFNGSIRFLFRTDKNEYDWNLFDDRLPKVKKYFYPNGVSEEYRHNNILLRLLICGFTKWEHFWGCVYDNNAFSWREILLNKRWISPLNFLFKEDEPKTFDYASFNLFFEDQNEQSILIHSDLCKSNLLNCIENGCTLKYRNNQYALYPDNTKAKWKIYVIGNIRNSIFSKLLEEKKIDLIINGECGKIENCPYFWGWRLYFEYNSSTYYLGIGDKLHKYNDELETWEIEDVSLKNIESYFE
jgi:hypothetical protein